MNSNNLPFEEEKEEEHFQLSPELKSTMDQLIMDWVRLHYEELEEEIKNIGFHTTEDINGYLMNELFHQRDRWSFGKYLKNSNQITGEGLIQIIQCCCFWYEHVENIMGFKTKHDLEYIGFYFGMMYVEHYVNVDIVQMIEEMNCSTILK